MKKPTFFHSKFFWNLLFSKLSITLFAIFIYATFSPFQDAERYLNAESSWDLAFIFNRTLFADLFYSTLRKLLFSNVAVHLFTSAFLAYILWFVFKREFYFLNKTLFVFCLLLPHFMIWSGVVGKEALAIAAFLVLVRSCVDLAIGNKILIIPFFIALFVSLIVRPHYALAYLYLLIMTLFIVKSKVRLLGYLSAKTMLFVFAIFLSYILFLAFFFHDFYSTYLLRFMEITQSYFLSYTNSTANRWDIHWLHPEDFVFNLWWGLPISIIGPTWTEALARPIIFPVFLEGCFSLLLFCIILIGIIRFALNNARYSSVIIWGLLPAILMGLFINYSFGIFNAGSAIRYKQSLAPLFYFYPLLLMAAIRRKTVV